MTTEWEFKYPLVTVHALGRGVSDHTPLLLDTRRPAFTGISKPFKMELSWFYHEDFYDRVVEIWNKLVRGQNSIQRWIKKECYANISKDGPHTRMVYINNRKEPFS
jgi:hypothetical protein